MAKKLDESILKELELKDQLIAKLNDLQKKYLIAYATNHLKMNDLKKNVVLLASLELMGKDGAAYLAGEGLATIAQLKSLDKAQISMLVDDYNNNHDQSEISKMIKDMIISEQQEKMYIKSNGLNGEFHSYTKIH